MSKVIAINGSPRADGNTAQMLKTVLDVCSKAGHDPNCIRWGLQCVGEIKKDKWNINVFERQRNNNNIFTC